MARSLAILIFLFAATMGVVPQAESQERSSRVVIGEGDDLTRSGTWGGAASAGAMGSGCVGYVPNVPQYLVDVVQAGWVRISVEADGGADTTLVLRGNSDTLCNDDANDTTLDPEIATYLAVGEYGLYVGGFTVMEQGDFNLSIHHGGRDVAPEISGDRPLSFQGVSGGQADAAAHGPGCIGAISESPNHTFLLPRRTFLQFSASASSDLTIVVKSTGQTLCNDDGLGTLDPVVQGWFSEGLVQVFVGSHNPRISANYELSVQPISVE